jgi:hypothetical protein
MRDASCSRSLSRSSLCAAYVWWCDRIIGPDVDSVVDAGTADATAAVADEEALAS